MKPNPSKSKPATAKPLDTQNKPSKVQDYGKKTFKNNWSNTKTVYTRPR